MFNNFIKVAFRNLWRNKSISIINIFGLSVGMAVCIMILFWMQDEFSFDKFNENFGNIYRVAHIVKYEDQTVNSSKTPHPLGPTLKEDFPEVKEFTRYGTFVGEVLIRNGDRAFYELGGAYVDPGYFNIFTVPLITGDPENIFPDRFSTVISQTMAKKYFGNEDPVGNSLYLENFCELTVTGIYQDIPGNSHLRNDFLVPFILYESWGADLTDWKSWEDYTYILLNESVPTNEFDQKIKDLIGKYVKDNEDEIYLQPLGRIHLYSDLAYDSTAVLGDINNVYLFGSIALVILVLGCINFINLTTAKSLKRSKEVGMRKVIGADKKVLILQFLGETLLMSVFAFLVSLVLVELFLPLFNSFTGKHLHLGLLSYQHIFWFALLILLTGFLSGLYPAFFLSSFKTITVLQNRQKIGTGRSGFKLILIVMQFVLSIVLLISTLIIYDQLNYIQNKKLGFNKDHVIRIQSRPKMYSEYPVYKEQLLRNPQILNVTATDELELPFNIPNDQLDWEGRIEHENKIITGMNVDFDYLETLQIELVMGRSFSKAIPSDREQAIILNETAIADMGLEDPINLEISLFGKNYRIIGVMKDYHANSLKVPIRPLLMTINNRLPVYIYVRIDPKKISKTIKFLEDEWNKIIPHFPFEFIFLDEMINNIYSTEKKMGSIFFSFTLLAIMISSLGLLGLTAYSAEARTKEIGIRKVMGANISDIVWLLASQFTRLILLANIIAWPLAYFMVTQWLQNFAYRVDVKLPVFLAAGLGTIIISLLTISLQTFRSASTNPVNALKFE